MHESDEAGLWKRQEDFENQIKNSGFLYNDDQLTSYLNDVLYRLTGDLESKNNVDLRVYVIRDPEFNAFCLSNGAIFVHTGILSAIDNEAQLATLLAHESSHFIYRHELKFFRNLKNKSAFLSTMQVTVAAAPVGYYGDLFNLFSQYCVVGSVYGYSRSMEREADRNAFDMIVNAGYDPLEAKKFLCSLEEAVKLEDKKKAVYFYSTHPKIKNRIKDYQEFIEELEKSGRGKLTGIKNAEAYHQLTRGVFMDDLELKINANKLKIADRLIEKYTESYPDDFQGYCLSGRVFMLENDKEEAEKQFKKSIELNNACPLSHKWLGLLYYKNGKKELAKVEFTRYLELDPQAADAAYIRGYLDEQ